MNSSVVLVVRHMDVRNPGNVFYGRLPRFGLSDLGQSQAERTAEYLAAMPVAAFYTSPQLRARQTTRILAARHQGAPVHVSRLLAEVRTSVQGLSFAVIGSYVNIYEPPKDPADETIAQVFGRMNRLLRRVARRHPGETVVCVSHADPIMFLRAGNQGLELRLSNMRGPDYPEKGSITRFEFVPGEPAPRISYVDVGRLVGAAGRAG
jgi:probable phosphoglycerate mutase